MSKVYVFALLVILTWGSFSIIIAGSVSAETYVNSNITTNTTWTATNSPYIVIGNVTVTKNATLSIDPGAMVKFAGGASLIIKGNLSAVGSETSKIVFTSNKPHPNPGDWGTIKFEGGANQTFMMKYCIVQYGSNGVTIQSVGKSKIENSQFYNNSYAINVMGNSNLQIKNNIFEFNHVGIFGAGDIISNVTIGDNTISNNNWESQPQEACGIYLKVTRSGWGVHTTIQNVNISGNTISSNGGPGIFLNATSFGASSTTIQNVNISGNTISSNGGPGIFLNATSYDGYYRTSSSIYATTINGNTISSNGGSGIYLLAYSVSGSTINATIKGNKISSNSGSGIYLFAYNSPYIFVIINGNNISLNGQAGIKAYATSLSQYGMVSLPLSMVISKNYIYANLKGMNISGITTNITYNSIGYNVLCGISYNGTINNTAHFNDIYGNKYGMNVSNGAVVNAENNWWGNDSGPYHPSINPSGTGNAVNGNGTNLKFVPWAKSPVSGLNILPPPSHIPSPHIGAPEPPKSLYVLSNINAVTLSWSPPDKYGKTPIIKYNIYLLDESNNSKLIATVKSTKSSIYIFTISNLTMGKKYSFYVTAVNSVGESNPSNIATATPIAGNGYSLYLLTILGIIIMVAFIVGGVLSWQKKKLKKEIMQMVISARGGEQEDLEADIEDENIEGGGEDHE